MTCTPEVPEVLRETSEIYSKLWVCLRVRASVGPCEQRSRSSKPSMRESLVEWMNRGPQGLLHRTVKAIGSA